MFLVVRDPAHGLVAAPESAADLDPLTEQALIADGFTWHSGIEAYTRTASTPAAVDHTASILRNLGHVVLASWTPLSGTRQPQHTPTRHRTESSPVNTAHTPPPPNPRQARGFLVTLSIPTTVPAARLQQCDVFALPEQQDRPLTVANVRKHPSFAARLLIDVHGTPEPLTLKASEPVQPLSMPRHVDVTCQLCRATTSTALDLVAHGEPQTWVCSLH